jgi:hypothetical protein
MSISTYLRPNIHQNGPEISGVNCGNFYILHFNSFYFQNILYTEDAPKHVPTILIFSATISSECLLHWEKKKTLYVNFGIPPCGKKFSFYYWKIT